MGFPPQKRRPKYEWTSISKWGVYSAHYFKWVILQFRVKRILNCTPAAHRTFQKFKTTNSYLTRVKIFLHWCVIYNTAHLPFRNFLPIPAISNEELLALLPQPVQRAASLSCDQEQKLKPFISLLHLRYNVSSQISYLSSDFWSPF